MQIVGFIYDNSMHDLSAINEVISNAVRSSSYNTVLLSSCIFIVYTLIIKIIDMLKAKNRNRPVIEMATAIKDIGSNIIKLNNVLDKTFKDAEHKDYIRCKNAIRLAFEAMKSKLNEECIETIITNHIEENKEQIVENILKLISTEYYKVYSILSNYEIDNVNVASQLDKRWIEQISNTIISVIYGKKSDISRILQLQHRLNIEIGKYETYIDNKVFSK
jgi:hypothetical protein|nr:MAG TPA: hypothetical protein [Crassvirales sp.]